MIFFTVGRQAPDWPTHTKLSDPSVWGNAVGSYLRKPEFVPDSVYHQSFLRALASASQLWFRVTSPHSDPLVE